MIKGKRRKAPVSTLRARLNERIREKDESDRHGEYGTERTAEPFFLVDIFRRMHRFLIIKVTVAVVVVLAAAILYRGDYPWGKPLIDAVRFVAVRDFNTGTISDQVVPAFRAAWNNWELPSFRTGDQASGLQVPLRGSLKSGFGPRSHPLEGHDQMHYGVDLTAPAGSTVTAVLEGWVRDILREEGLITVVLDHDDAWQTVYYGLSIVTAQIGEIVAQGGKLGALGEAFLYEQPHLHFELRWNGYPVAPPAQWLTQFQEHAL